MRHWFADLNAFRHDPMTLFLERAGASDKPMQKLNLGPSPVYLVTDPKLVKPILKASDDVVDKGRLIHTLRAAVGMSSLTMSGEVQKKRRGVFHRLMARGAAEQYTCQMAAVIRQTVMELMRHDRFNANEISGPLALKLISVVLFGHEVLSRGDEAALVHAVRQVEDDLARDMFRMLPKSPWARRRQSRARAETRATMRLVVERASKHVSASSAVSGLQKIGLGTDEIGDEILTMLITGHHTTGAAAAWLLYFLATQEGLADRIAREAQEITDDNGELRPDQLNTASCSNALVRETLRLFPSAWWFSREIKQTVEFGGKALKPGTSLILSPWQYHRDPRFWSNPDMFDLDRNFASAAYVPFGAGPRACVGMGAAMLELQVLALETASAFQIDYLGDRPPARPAPSITLIPPQIPVRIRPRLESVVEDCQLEEKAA
jgi:cytochrome P450